MKKKEWNKSKLAYTKAMKNSGAIDNILDSTIKNRFKKISSLIEEEEMNKSNMIWKESTDYNAFNFDLK
jgi:hypothetical protein